MIDVNNLKRGLRSNVFKKVTVTPSNGSEKTTLENVELVTVDGPLVYFAGKSQRNKTHSYLVNLDQVAALETVF